MDTRQDEYLEYFNTSLLSINLPSIPVAVLRLRKTLALPLKTFSFARNLFSDISKIVQTMWQPSLHNNNDQFGLQ